VTVQPVLGLLNAVEAAVQTDLVRVLTHEILNSLTPVTSLAETAANLLEGSDLGGDHRIADARAAVGALARRAAGLSHFIEAYRAVARAPEVEKREFLARSWAEELVRLFDPKATGVSVALEVEPADLVLNADPDLLAQVVINLLRNAAQAMAGHTASPSILVRIMLRGDLSLIEVEDNGPGVPIGLRQDIFLPFFTTRKQGSGVGLNLARQITLAHGGAIEVAEGKEGGALIRLGWPRR
jgi:signal transduction histidine kinase